MMTTAPPRSRKATIGYQHCRNIPDKSGPSFASNRLGDFGLQPAYLGFRIPGGVFGVIAAGSRLKFPLPHRPSRTTRAPPKPRRNGGVGHARKGLGLLLSKTWEHAYDLIRSPG